MAMVGALVPLFLPAPSIFALPATDTNTLILGKLLLLQVLSACVISAGALLLLTPLWQRLFGPVRLAFFALLAWLLWGTTSVLVNPGSGYTISLWLPTLLTGAAALFGPLALSDDRRCKWLLLAILFAAIIVAFIGVTSSLGYSGFNTFLYGGDIREWATKYADRMQGGTRSAAAMSTLANPEYAGTYAAVAVSIWAIVLLDWCGTGRRGLILRALCLGVIGLILLHVVFSGSRNAFVSIFLAGIFRLFLQLRVPPLYQALGFAVFVFSLVLFGFIVGLAALMALVLLGLLWSVWSGTLRENLLKTNRFTRAFVLGAPVVMVLFFVAFSIPGPWNPTGIRIYERFSSLATKSDQSALQRLVMFSLASNMVNDNPIFGVGPGRYRNQFTVVLTKLVEEDPTGVMDVTRIEFGNRIGEQTHNDYLQIAAETGLVGLSLFLLLLVSVIAGLVRIVTNEEGTRRQLAMATLIGIVAFCSVMLSSFPLQMPGRMAFFWMLIACAMGLIATPPKDVADAPALPPAEPARPAPNTEPAKPRKPSKPLPA